MEEGTKLRSSERSPNVAEGEGRDCLLIVVCNVRAVQKMQIMQMQLQIHQNQRGTFMYRSYFQLTGIHYIWTLMQAGAR